MPKINTIVVAKPKRKYLYIETDMQCQFIFYANKRFKGYKELTFEELAEECMVSKDTRKYSKFVINLEKIVELKVENV